MLIFHLMELAWISRKIGFRYSALCVGDKAMKDPYVIHETNSSADVLL